MTGAEIKALRERLGETQVEFARRFGVTRQAIFNWEQRGTPTKAPGAIMWMTSFRRLCKAVRNSYIVGKQKRRKHAHHHRLAATGLPIRAANSRSILL
jgi:DNA-binding XRE family transcriptional regulator